MAGESSTQVRAATRATYAVFIASGFAFASWASRIPTVRAHLGLDPERLGLVLLSIAAGSVVSLPITGWVIHRSSTRRTVAGMALLLSLGLVIVGVGYSAGTAVVVIGLFLLGFGNGAWDVAMNVQGAGVERRLGRAIMPRFHAGFSLGTVIGALGGAGMVALGVPVIVHLTAVAIIAGVVVQVAVRDFLADTTDTDEGAVLPGTTDTEGVVTREPNRVAGVFTRWREPRTLLIGLFVLAFAFAEGTGNDWISVALIDGYHVHAAVGTLGYAAFLTAMTSGRWVGPPLLDRFGRVAVVRVLAAVAVLGLLLFVVGPSPVIAYIGALLWGLGVSLCFPVGMSAAADDPAAAAARVSVVASVGYCAFLGGPPLIGFLAAQVGVRHAFVAVAVLVAIAACLGGVLRPPAARSDQVADRHRTADLPG